MSTWLNDSLNDYRVAARLRDCVLPEEVRPARCPRGVMCSSGLEVLASKSIGLHPAAMEWLRARRIGPALFRSLPLLEHARLVAQHGEAWWRQLGPSGQWDRFFAYEDKSAAWHARFVWRPVNPGADQELDELGRCWFEAVRDWRASNRVWKLGPFLSWHCVIDVPDEWWALKWVRRLAEARAPALLAQWMGWGRSAMLEGADARVALDGIAEIAELLEPGRLRELLGERAA